MSYSKNQIYIHCGTWILSLTDVYYACSSFLFLVGVIPLLYVKSTLTSDSETQRETFHLLI